MLFFTRCFLCIGTIVVLAEGLDLTGVDLSRVGAAIGPAVTRRATNEVEALCRQKPSSCLAAATAALGAGQDRAGSASDAPLSGPIAAARPARIATRHGGADPDLSLRHRSPR